jgi:broad specificity phosphatase PhoE
MTVPAPAAVRVVLLRHGEAAVPPDHYPDHARMLLSPTGEQQAAAAARWLATPSFDRIVTSPLRRAMQTAEAVAGASGLAVEVDERLAERVFPALYGLSYATIAARFGNELAATMATGNSDGLSMPGAEDLHQCADRIGGWVADVTATGPHTILAVTHGGPHGWLLSRLLGLDPSRAGRRFTIGTCRLTALDLAAGSGTLLRIAGMNLSVEDYRVAAGMGGAVRASTPGSPGQGHRPQGDRGAR